MTIWDVVAALLLFFSFPANALRYYINHRRNADHLVLDPNFWLMVGAALMIIVAQTLVAYRVDTYFRATIFVPLALLWAVLTALTYQLDRIKR